MGDSFDFAYPERDRREREVSTSDALRRSVERVEELEALLIEFAFKEVQHPDIGPMAQCRNCKEVDKHVEGCKLSFLEPWKPTK